MYSCTHGEVSMCGLQRHGSQAWALEAAIPAPPPMPIFTAHIPVGILQYLENMTKYSCEFMVNKIMDYIGTACLIVVFVMWIMGLPISYM